jgi:PhnB protein
MHLETYLYFNGRCEAAMDFYREALGAETLVMLRFKDSPDALGVPPEWQDKIMHAAFRIAGRDLLATDGPPDQPSRGFRGFTLSITVPTAQEGERLYHALALGGTVLMPWQGTFWTEGFGTLTDRFGVPWMVNVEHKEAQAA